MSPVPQDSANLRTTSLSQSSMVVICSLAITGYDQVAHWVVTPGSQAGTGTAVIFSGLTIHNR
jgi:hypothetical protein